MQIGDWGREGGQNQTAVAEAMARKADSFHPEFVISVGDNFYESKPLPRKTYHPGSKPYSTFGENERERRRKVVSVERFAVYSSVKSYARDPVSAS